VLIDPSERLLEWASTIGSAAVDRFRNSYAWAFDSTDRAEGTRALSRLERLCHVDIDWDRGRWWVTPPALSNMAGGNCMLVGARNRTTLAVLDAARAEGRVRITRLQQPDTAPDAVFVEVATDTDLRDLADDLSVSVVADPRRVYSEMLNSLDMLLESAHQRFAASGLQARELDAATMTFEPVEIRGGRWRPGCFEQRSRGIARYLFVDDDGALHNTSRQVAIHAEIRRATRNGRPVYAGGVPIAWDKQTERLLCGSLARLPLMHERAAILCSGLLPTTKRVELHGRPTSALVYEGVAATTYGSIIRSLDYPPVNVSLPMEDTGS
jgi:hypothetical protein